MANISISNLSLVNSESTTIFLEHIETGLIKSAMARALEARGGRLAFITPLTTGIIKEGVEY
jgi:hypothetical protein